MANTLSKLDRQAVGRSAQLLGGASVVKTRRVKRIDRNGAVFCSFLIKSWNQVVPR
jgi:hypothetical protein